MDFSTANLALVAYASVDSDGTLLKSSGFLSSQHLGTGMYLLTLTDELAQEPYWNEAGVYPDFVMVSLAGSNTSTITAQHSNAKQISVASVSLAPAFQDNKFNVLVFRSVIPPTTTP